MIGFIFVDLFKPNGSLIYITAATVFLDMIDMINTNRRAHVLDLSMTIHLSHSTEIYSHHALFPRQQGRFLVL